MFMDAVGSTSAGEQTDPESLRRVMTRYFDEIRTVVERHGGTVEKYIGDAVMAVFGVPTVHEDDALRAIRAAVEIRSRLATVSDELRRDRGISVEWRTGINTGEVVAGDAGAGQRFVSGDAVNTAARLEQAASAGEILLGAETHRLVRDFATLESAEAVAAKGKSEPVATFRLLSVDLSGPTPARRLDLPMVGRQRQRRLLAEAYEQVVDERVCHLFTVLGAAGVGKSRLVAEFLDEVSTDALILQGRCLSYGEGITYWPIAEAIREAASLDESDSDETIRDKLGALISDERDRQAAVEQLGRVLGRFGAGGSREEAFWAVRTLLEALAAKRPVVLVLDDIHWAEPTLLDLIESLAELIRGAPVLLLCVARHELQEKRPAWGGGMSSATTITLEALNDGESRELIANILGQVELSADLVERIGSSAEGNPLFVEEMLSMLIDRGFLERRGGGWVAVTSLSEVSVPPTIQALLAARLDGLPSDERAVIERGSVEGKIFHRGAVAELAPVGLRATVPEHLRALSRKELLRPDRSDFAGDEAFRFRHLLIRDAAYSAMPKEARADLHERFAAWLERVSAEHVAEYEEILGYHLERAYTYRRELGPMDDRAEKLGEAAGGYLGSSGYRALERGDIAAGTKLLRAAVEVTPTGSPGRDLALAHYIEALSFTGEVRAASDLAADESKRALEAGHELGAAQIEMAGMFPMTTLGQLTIVDIIARSEELLRIFQREGDEWGMRLATLEIGRHRFFAGRAREAAETFENGIRRFPESAPHFIGWLLSTHYWGSTPVEEAFVTVRKFDTVESRILQALLLRAHGGLNRLLGEFDKGREALQRSKQIEQELGNQPRVDSLLGHFLGPLESDAGNYATAEGYLLQAFENMIARDDTGFSTTVAGHLAHLYIRWERWSDAQIYAQKCLVIAQPDDVEANASGSSAMGRVAAHGGDFETAEMLCPTRSRSLPSDRLPRVARAGTRRPSRSASRSRPTRRGKSGLQSSARGVRDARRHRSCCGGTEAPRGDRRRPLIRLGR